MECVSENKPRMIHQSIGLLHHRPPDRPLDRPTGRQVMVTLTVAGCGPELDSTGKELQRFFSNNMFSFSLFLFFFSFGLYYTGRTFLHESPIQKDESDWHHMITVRSGDDVDDDDDDDDDEEEEGGERG